MLCHKMNVFSLELLFNSEVGLDRTQALACFACTGWDTCPALLALLPSLNLKVLLNVTGNLKQFKV